jgi:hypothetical protein
MNLFAHSADPPLWAASARPCGGYYFLRAIMSAQMINVSISLAAIATSAISVFAVSWIGLALLGY